jgi:hypothetical protein
MEDYVNYLDESLRPLEEKAQEYLLLEERLRYIDIENDSATHQFIPEEEQNKNPETGDKTMASAQLQQGVPIIKTPETHQSPEEIKSKLSQLKQEIIAMLPETNKFIPVDLGYGPSSIGAFPNKEKPEELDLIIVH